MFRTHYDNLQVTRSASNKVIKAAYKSLAHEWHPDRNHDRPKEAEQNIKIINEAYRVLSNPERRRQHDLWIQKKENNSQTNRDEYGSRREPHQDASNNNHNGNYAEGYQHNQHRGDSNGDNYSGSREEAYAEFDKKKTHLTATLKSKKFKIYVRDVLLFGAACYLMLCISKNSGSAYYISILFTAQIFTLVIPMMMILGIVFSVFGLIVAKLFGSKKGFFDISVQSLQGGAYCVVILGVSNWAGLGYPLF